MKTSNDPTHWSAAIDMMQRVIDAEYGDRSEERKDFLKLVN